MIDWIVKNWVEVVAATLGIVYLFLSIKENILLWVFGLLTSALYIYVFYVSKFYADMSLQAYYVVISVYGWLHWKNGGKTTEELPVTAVGPRLLLTLLAATAFLWLIMSVFLDQFTDSSVPIGDGFTTAGSIVATWMLARKIKEHWIFWIVIDGISLGLYLYKGLYPTSVLFIVYTIMAAIGYMEWNKSYKANPVKQKMNGFRLANVKD